jgi:hypothetical protein
MEHPFSFLRSANFSFFDENDGFDGELDLKGFTFDKDAAHGMVEKIIEDARLVLADVPSSAVQGILWFADHALHELLDQINLVVGGERVPKGSVDFKSANQIDFIHLILGAFAKNRIAIASEGVPDVEVTPTRFCAAYALRMMFNATRDYLNFGEQSALRDYYLMQAAFAHGVMKSFSHDDEFSIAEAVATISKSRIARRGANTRWNGDPSQAAKVAMHEEWKRWQMDRSLYAKPSDFRARMLSDHGAVVNEGTLKNWMTGWRKDWKPSRC